MIYLHWSLRVVPLYVVDKDDESFICNAAHYVVVGCVLLHHNYVSV